MDVLFQGTKVTVRNLLSLVKGACGHAHESLIANRVRGVACAGDTSFSPPCLFSKQPYLASSEATISGTPRCKGVSAADTRVCSEHICERSEQSAGRIKIAS